MIKAYFSNANKAQKRRLNRWPDPSLLPKVEDHYDDNADSSNAIQYIHILGINFSIVFQNSNLHIFNEIISCPKS